MFERPKFTNVITKASTLIKEADDARDLGDWPLAAERYGAALNIDATRGDIWVQYGHALKESGKLHAALDAYREGVTRTPHSSDAHLQLGHALKLLGDFIGARQSYETALSLDGQNRDAARELGRNINASGLKIRSRADADYVFDISDLMQYFESARLPTGIQRVQIEVISSLLKSETYGKVIDIVSFDRSQTGWKQVSRSDFVHLAELALVDSNTKDPIWVKARSLVQQNVDADNNYVFKTGATLINLGTSWWLQNYFINIRSAKEKYNIRYVPFVHDCIPVITPENCVKELTQDFVGWLIGVFGHGDGYIANSQSTANDLIAMGQRLGSAVDDVRVVRLDGRFSAAQADERENGKTGQTVRVRQITQRPFVLFVSTIEARKNHLLVLDSWLTLLRKHGEANIPNLICVGNRGWLVDAVFSKHAASPSLKRKVSFVHGLSDTELSELYKCCQFFVYPSTYEGWGLPVTEALCFGKTGIVANSSSLPEAGGDFVTYFDPGSRTEFINAVESMLFTDGMREEAEDKIRKSFKPRLWGDIATEILVAVDSHKAAVVPKTFSPHKILTSGRFYPFTRNFEREIWPGMIGNEVFRDGDGWHSPDDFGCWLKADTADLSFVADRDGPAQVFIEMVGLPSSSDLKYDAMVQCGLSTDMATLNPGATAWLAVDVELQKGQVQKVLVTVDGLCNLWEWGTSDETRVVTGALSGFIVVFNDDLEGRLRFQEALALKRRDRILQRAAKY